MHAFDGLPRAHSSLETWCTSFFWDGYSTFFQELAPNLALVMAGVGMVIAATQIPWRQLGSTQAEGIAGGVATVTSMYYTVVHPIREQRALRRWLRDTVADVYPEYSTAELRAGLHAFTRRHPEVLQPEYWETDNHRARFRGALVFTRGLRAPPTPPAGRSAPAA